MRNVTLFAANAVDVKTDNGATAAFDVSAYERVLVYANLTALSGGTTPSVTYWYQEQDAFGNWYDVAKINASPLTAAGKAQNSYGSGAALPGMVGIAGRVRWAIVGSPTTATSSINVLADED